MRERIRFHVTQGVLVAATCLVASTMPAASETPASPPAAVAPQAAPSPGAPTPAPQKPDDRQARWKADREAFLEARLAALHAGLQLKPDQDALWPPVETAIRGFAKLRADRWAAMKAEEASGQGEGALDRLRHGSERLIARGQAMKTLADAAAPLMASLDASQKDRLPRLLEGLRPRRVLGEALGGSARDRDDRGGWRGMRHERMDRFGMRGQDMGGQDMRGQDMRGQDMRGQETRGQETRGQDERDGRDGMDRREGAEPGRGPRAGLAERDGMRDDRRGGGDMPMRRHHHHEDDEGSDRT